MDGPRRWPAAVPALVFAGLAAGLTVAGWRNHREQERSVQRRAEAELDAVADAKVAQIGRWRREREEDANSVVTSPVLARASREVLAGTASHASRRELERHLEILAAAHAYRSICLIDAEGRVRLEVGTRCAGRSHVKALIDGIGPEGGTAFSDLVLDDSRTVPHLHAAARLPGPGTAGAVAMRMDADEFLYPLLRRWPTVFPSAEALLVRREGEEVVYLSPLRHRRAAPLSLRVPAASRDLAAAAVLGRDGPEEGIDYRGVRVLAVAKSVPGTGWRVLTKIDREDVLGEARQRGWLVAAAMGSLVLAAGALLLAWWVREVRRTREGRRRLEEKVALRERLGQAERMAAVGTLAGGMAHEINNPLSCIVANLRFLRAALGRPAADAEEAAEVEQAIADAADAAERMRDIVAALRAFAVGETEYPTRTCLRAAIDESVKVAHHALQACSEVACEAADLPEIEVNPQSVVQVLASILVNAGQATADRPNRVRIRAGAEGSEHVFVEVADTGAGIPAAVLPHIFEPFFSTKSVGKGKGLGLSVSLGIARALGGDIRAESRVGEGTTFRVVLPRRRASPAARA
jgi:signal transduction histidine kinase